MRRARVSLDLAMFRSSSAMRSFLCSARNIADVACVSAEEWFVGLSPVSDPASIVVESVKLSFLLMMCGLAGKLLARDCFLAGGDQRRG